MHDRGTLRARDWEAGNTGDPSGERGSRGKSCFEIPTGERVGRGRWPLLSPSRRSWGGGSGSARVLSLGFDQLIPDPPAPGARGKDPTGQGATRGRSHPRLGGGGGGCSPRVSESRIRGGERDARSTRKLWLHGGAASESNEFLAAGAGMAPGVAESAARRPWKPLAQGTGKKEGSTPRNCGVPLTRRKLGCYSGLCRRENNSVGGTRAGRAESELTPTSAHRSAAGRLYAIQKVGS
nr:uncharacterized protein LOC123569370 [Macaca fascicularis]